MGNTAEDLRNRLHPSTPNIIINPVTARGSMDDIAKQMEEDQQQLAEYARLLEEIQEENKGLRAELKPLGKFKHILESTATRMPVYIRSNIVMGMAKALLVDVHTGANVESESKSIRQQSQLRLDHIFEVVMEHMLTNRIHEVKAILRNRDNENRPPV